MTSENGGDLEGMDDFEREVAEDLAWERGLAIKCVVSVCLVVLLVIVRQLYLI